MFKIIIAIATLSILSTPVLSQETTKGHTVNVCNNSKPEVSRNGDKFFIEINYRFPELSNQIGKLNKNGECHNYLFEKDTVLEWKTSSFENPNFLGSRGVRKILVNGNEETTTVNFEGQYNYGQSQVLMEEIHTTIELSR